MKKLFTLLLIFFSSCLFSQNLNVNFLEQILKISFLDIENVMTEGYGFKKIKSENDWKQLKFAKISDGNIDNAIIINIFDAKYSINNLDITVAKNFSIEKIKQNFIENSYLYAGEKYNFLIYKKEHLGVMISKTPNEAGANQIIISYIE